MTQLNVENSVTDTDINLQKSILKSQNHITFLPLCPGPIHPKPPVHTKKASLQLELGRKGDNTFLGKSFVSKENITDFLPDPQEALPNDYGKSSDDELATVYLD